MSIDLINFRSLDRIKTQDGRMIKEGLFYRGPSLVLRRLSYEDKRYLDSLGLKHIVDLRGDDEVARAGELYIPKGSSYHHIPAITIDHEIAHDDLDTLAGDGMSFEDAYMARIYRTLPFDNKAYRYLFDLIKDDEVPLYFHCSAGKDRTGIFAALLELLLGVSKEDIIKDYMVSSSIYLTYYKEVLGLEDIDSSWLCNELWLEGTLKAPLIRYSTYEEFFKEEYDLDKSDIEAIKERYLVSSHDDR